MKSELIARQSRLPQGWLGEIVARVMSLETTAANQRAIERLGQMPNKGRPMQALLQGRQLRGNVVLGNVRTYSHDLETFLCCESNREPLLEKVLE